MNMKSILAWHFCLISIGILRCLLIAARAGQLQGEIVDAESGGLLPARLYIQAQSGKFYLAKSASPQGSSVTYNKDRGVSQEIHSTLSADSFVADLPAGEYIVTAERGKEYISGAANVTIGEGITNVRLALRRWIRMADRGWYSGDTHVHRAVADMPNLQLAEDLNVSLPLTYWVTDFDERPDKNNKNTDQIPAPELNSVDATHVY